MPLSEHEQQLLAQLEKQLHEDDPRFASSMHTETVRGRGSMRNLVLGVVVAVVGLGILLAGVATQLIVAGVLGFVVMAVGTFVATLRGTASSPSRPDGQNARPRTTTGSRKSSTFLQGLEDKWEKRNQGGL